VVVEAAGTSETAEAAVRAVRKGGLVNLFAGCPADARIEIDASRLHYEEVTVTSSFHHTPSSLREAFRLIIEGKVSTATLISGEAPLEDLPGILQQMSESGGALKVAIIP
jgi:L-iditol 2-dehydrogenase